MIPLAVAALALLTGPAAAREPLGLWGSWGAFRDMLPVRCYAIAQPLNRRSGWAAVTRWPTQASPQVHFRLSRPRSPQAAVTLSVGDRRFALRVRGEDAWAPDERTDAAVVSALRDGRSLSVETVAANGQPFADVYALSGAPTAIDAASLACLRR